MGNLTFRCRFPSRLSHAVEKAAHAEKALPDVLEVKDKNGVIKDSVRETIADLVGIENVPAKSCFRIFKKCANSTGTEVIGTWSRRSIPRIMHETVEAAEILIIERVLDSMGM
jgi:hypothetical protein